MFPLHVLGYLNDILIYILSFKLYYIFSKGHTDWVAGALECNIPEAESSAKTSDRIISWSRDSTLRLWSLPPPPSLAAQPSELVASSPVFKINLIG